MTPTPPPRASPLAAASGGPAASGVPPAASASPLGGDGPQAPARRDATRSAENVARRTMRAIQTDPAVGEVIVRPAAAGTRAGSGRPLPPPPDGLSCPPEDIAMAIGFLCSAEARTITGVLLPVDSGWHASVSYKTYAGGVPWKD